MANIAQSKASNSSGSNGNGKQQPAVSGGDSFKWLLFWALVVAALVANVYYQDVVWALRAAAGVVLLCLLVAIAATTALGSKAWQFMIEAKAELRKVVWPTRAETVQTALLVVVMVVIVALILWGLDSVLMWGIGFLTL